MVAVWPSVIVGLASRSADASFVGTADEIVTTGTSHSRNAATTPRRPGVPPCDRCPHAQEPSSDLRSARDAAAGTPALVPGLEVANRIRYTPSSSCTPQMTSRESPPGTWRRPIDR